MKPFIFVVSLACLLQVAAPSSSHAQISLGWTLQEGDRFLVTTETQGTLETKTARDGREPRTETETRTDKIVRRFIVKSAAADRGAYDVELALDSLDVTATTPARSVHYVARQQPDDHKHVEVNIKSTNAMMAGRDVKLLLEKFASNMLDQRIGVTMQRTGRVQTVNAEGKLLANMAAETPVAKDVLHNMKKLIKAEDAATMATAFAFPVFTEATVQVGGNWRTEHAFTAMGLKLSGRSSATLTAVETVEGRRVASIKESVEYSADAEQLAGTLQEMIAADLKHAKREVKISLSFKPVTGVKAEQDIRFDVDAGHPISIECRELTVPVTGELVLTAEDRKTTVAIDVVARVTSKTTWAKQ